MAVTREEIIKALKVIRDVCNEYDCYHCPLRDSMDNCMLETEATPIDWILNEREEWRAFLND